MPNLKTRSLPVDGSGEGRGRGMLDKAIHTLLRVLISDDMIWRETSVPWIRYYYAESGVYLLRDMRHASPSFALVAARAPDEAAEYQRRSGGWEKVETDGSK